METLVIYFSQKGKTKEAARRIAQLSGADLAEIKTHKSYRMSYRKTVFTSLKEILLNERPELDMEIPDISAYDRILIGSPIWCGTIPNAVKSIAPPEKVIPILTSSIFINMNDNPANIQ